MTKSKIIAGLDAALVSAKCDHAFEYVKPFPYGNGEVALCTKCRCRFTAWPGTADYAAIVEARDSSKTPNT